MKWLKRLFHVHDWQYWVGKDAFDGDEAWNRGCHKCGKIEIATKSGNSFLFSRWRAENMLRYRSKESFIKEAEERQRKLDIIRSKNKH